MNGTKRQQPPLNFGNLVVVLNPQIKQSLQIDKHNATLLLSARLLFSVAGESAHTHE